MGGRLPLNPYPWLFLGLTARFWDKSKFTGLGGKNHRSLTGYNRSLHLIFLGWEDKPIYAPMGPFCKWLVFEWVLFSQGIWSTTQGIVSLHLVGGFNPNLNNYIVKMDHFPRVWGENKKYVKPPPSHSITLVFWDGLTYHSGQIIRFHHPRKGISCTKPPFGVTSCVAMFWHTPFSKPSKHKSHEHPHFSIFISVLAEHVCSGGQVPQHDFPPSPGV